MPTETRTLEFEPGTYSAMTDAEQRLLWQRWEKTLRGVASEMELTFGDTFPGSHPHKAEQLTRFAWQEVSEQAVAHQRAAMQPGVVIEEAPSV